MLLWLKQRFAHLVLAPSPTNPMVRRWQRPFHDVKRLVELTERWESGVFTSYEADADLAQQTAEAISRINPELLTEMAQHDGKLYAQAKGVPLWSDLNEIFGDRTTTHTVAEHIGRLTKRQVGGVGQGDLVSALSFIFQLRDDTLYLEEGKLKIAPVSDPNETGTYAFGTLTAYEALPKINPATLKRIRENVNRFDPTDEIVEAKRRVERIKDALYRVLGGRWERLGVNEVSRRLGDKLKTFTEDLRWVAEFVHIRRPDLTEVLGLTDDKGNLQMVNWDRLKNILYSGTHGIKGRPTLLDSAVYLIAQAESDRKNEPSFLETVFKGLTKSELRDVVSPFKRKLSEPIPNALKDACEKLKDLDLPDGAKERLDALLNSKTWDDLFTKDELHDAFQAYLYTLTQVA